MSAASSVLLANLRSLGITISADGDNLVIRPASKLTPELRSDLRVAKKELLALLQPERLCQNPDTAGAVDAGAIRQAWPEAAVLPAETKPLSPTPGPSFDALVQRLVADRAPAAGEREAARHAYRQAERAKREQDNPRAWRFGLGWLARDFLIQNDAWEWLARPTRVRPRYSVHSWPFDQIPDAATLDALYAELWDEIERQGRYRGP